MNTFVVKYFRFVTADVRRLRNLSYSAGL